MAGMPKNQISLFRDRSSDRDRREGDRLRRRSALARRYRLSPLWVRLDLSFGQPTRAIPMPRLPKAVLCAHRNADGKLASARLDMAARALAHTVFIEGHLVAQARGDARHSATLCVVFGTSGACDDVVGSSRADFGRDGGTRRGLCGRATTAKSGRRPQWREGRARPEAPTRSHRRRSGRRGALQGDCKPFARRNKHRHGRHNPVCEHGHDGRASRLCFPWQSTPLRDPFGKRVRAPRSNRPAGACEHDRELPCRSRRMVLGVHHWISRKHLDLYLRDLAFRRSKRDQPTLDKLREAVAAQGRIFYADLVGIRLVSTSLFVNLANILDMPAPAKARLPRAAESGASACRPGMRRNPQASRKIASSAPTSSMFLPMRERSRPSRVFGLTGAGVCAPRGSSHGAT